MNDFKLDWDGKRAERIIDNAIELAVDHGAELVLKDAVRLAPTGSESRSGSGSKKRTPGSLKKSGRIESFKKKDAVGAYVKFGGVDVNGVKVFYAPFVELGTPGTTARIGGGKTKERTPIVAQPFLRPALKRNKGKIKSEFNGALK
jgi:hypothetical protein